MSEKIKYIDPDFWKHPDLWKLGDGYAETGVVLNTAIFEGVTLANFILLNIQTISVLGGADIRSLVPISTIGIIAATGLLLNATKAGQQVDLSEKAIKAGGVSNSMLRDSTNRWYRFDKVMDLHEAMGHKEDWRGIIRVRNNVEKELRDFANKAMKRESERSTKM